MDRDLHDHRLGVLVIAHGNEVPENLSVLIYQEKIFEGGLLVIVIPRMGK